MKHFLISLLLLLVIVPASWSQQLVNATIRGTVRDQSRAVIPGAAVTLTNNGTNIARNTVTDQAGVYSFPGTGPGGYRLTVDFTGMAKFEGNLTVQAAQDETIDVTMTVGTQASTVQVTDITPALVTDNDTLSQQILRDQIVNLPILGRGYQDLLETVPGMVYSSHGHDVDGRALAYGLQVGSTYITMDGNPLQEEIGGWDFPRIQDIDAVQEVHVETANSSARYSKPTTIVMSSRSGTNGFHGALFWDDRNSAYLEARARQDPAKEPYQNRNEWGGSVGGPVLIPKIYNGKNKTFWFFSNEETIGLIYSTSQVSVPTLAERSGDFSAITNSSGQAVNIYNPFTTNATTYQRAQFNYGGRANVIDPSLESPTAKLLFSYILPPNQPNINPALGPNLIDSGFRPLWQMTNSIRLDHHISDRDLVYFHYAANNHYECLGNGGGEYLPLNNDRWNFPETGECRNWPNHEISGTWTHTFSPTTTMEVQATGTTNLVLNGNGFECKGVGVFHYCNSYPVDYPNLLGLPNPFDSNGDHGADGHCWPSTSVGTGTGSVGSAGFSGMSQEEACNLQGTDAVTFQDNITKVVGKHELSFGLQLHWYDVPDGTATSSSQDTSTLSTSLWNTSGTLASPAAVGLTGANLANLFLGQFEYSGKYSRPPNILRKMQYATYIQDNWKVSPRLTLNLGLRWEVHTPYYDKVSTGMSFDLTNHAYVLGSPLQTYLNRGDTLPSLIQGYENLGGTFESTQQAGLPTDMYNINWHQFGPRIGFAYRALDGKKSFVIRGGYSMSYYQELVANIVSAFSSPQILSGTFSTSATSAALSPDGFPDYGLRTVPTVVAGVNASSSLIPVNSTALLTPGVFTGERINPNLPDPKVQEWSMTIEKELFPETVFRASYRGNHVTNQSATQALNSSPPTYLYELATGQAPPTGTFASVASRPYDQTIFGNVSQLNTLGFSWYNGVELSLERHFSHGFSGQVFWDMANSLLASGSVTDINQFAPGTVPTDPAAYVRQINYHRDNTVSYGGSGVGTPKNRIRWNFTYELPVGHGRKLLAQSNKIVDGILGGWQISAIGWWVTSYIAYPSGDFPTAAGFHHYGYNHPIQDCTSGVCYPGYIWDNGYISQKFLNSVSSNGQPNGIEGVPSNFANAVLPIIPYGSTTLPPNAPANTALSGFYDTNTEWVPLKNGTVSQTTWAGLNPVNNQYIAGPVLWFQDASISKTYRIHEKMNFRLEVRFFNVLNNPNNPTTVTSSGSDIGILDTRNSGGGAAESVNGRIAQLFARFNW